MPFVVNSFLWQSHLNIEYDSMGYGLITNFEQR